jgi:hypothetical protein
MSMRQVACAIFLSALVACGSDAGDDSPPAFRLPDDGLADGCHPFRSAGACGLPYPSSVWSEPDPSSRTTHRLTLPAELVSPSGSSKQPFDPSNWNRLDGFSPATPILAWFSEKLDDSSLPSQLDYTESLSPDSATLLVDMQTNELVAHFSELDQSADIEASDRQPLIVRPARHLSPNRRYAVAITRRLRTLEGSSPARPTGFDTALRGASSAQPTAARAIAALPEVIAAIEAVGARRQDLLLAWDFRTGSLEQMTENVLSMRDTTLAELGESGIGYAITTVEESPQPEIYKRLRGTFKVPSFLTNDDRSVPEAELVLGADGKPERQRIADASFELVIPASATAAGPYPLLIYGHGLLGGAGEISGSHVRRFCNDKGWLCIGTDWIGLSESEATGIGASAAAVMGVKDLNRFAWVGDRLQQGVVNFIALVRAARSIANDPQSALPDGESALADPFVVQYYGISQGGIMGMSFMAYSPDVSRGVLQVGGSAYSLMIQRSVNWIEFFPAIRNAYPDRIDQQLVMALWQPMFDRSEGSGTAFNQGIHPPLPGTPAKQLLMQIAVGDSQVTNLAAEIQARTLGLPLLSPSPKPVWGLETAESGAAQAISLWDLDRPPPPLSNATPTVDNRVHADIRKLPENQEQTDTFLRSGKVLNTCGGACSFPGFQP